MKRRPRGWPGDFQPVFVETRRFVTVQSMRSNNRISPPLLSSESADPTTRENTRRRWALVSALLVGPISIVARVVTSQHDAPRTSAPALALLEYGEAHWGRRSFVELVPPIPLPQDAALSLRARIYWRVPDGERLRLARLAGGATSIEWPAGSVIDRVEYYRRVDGSFHVADVRGTEILPNGRERFRCYRPDGSGRLVGVEWDRDDARGEQRAHQTMTRWFAGRYPSDPANVERFQSLLHCRGCHEHNQPEARPDDAARHLRRATDQQGFYVFRYAFEARAPMETYRPVDASQLGGLAQWITRRCPPTNERAPQRDSTERSGTNVRCANGAVPELVFDVPGAVEARVPHALATCASLRAVIGHIDALDALASPWTSACDPRQP
jgi:hypothetical protein